MRVDLRDATSLQPIGDPALIAGGSTLIEQSETGAERFATGAATATHPSLVWDVDPSHWEAMACNLAGRNLTRSEWAEYIPAHPYQATCPQWPAA